MSWARLVVLGLLLATLTLILLSVLMVVDTLTMAASPFDDDNGVLSAFQSPQWIQVLDEAGRANVAIGIGLVLFPVWLTTLVSAVAVWWIFVRREDRQIAQAHTLERQRRTWSWAFVFYHAYRLATAPAPVDRQRIEREVSRGLMSHLHVLAAGDRRRLMDFLRLSGVTDPISRELQAPEEPGLSRHPLEATVGPAIVLLSVASAFVLAWGLLSVVMLLHPLSMDFYRRLGFHFGPHEASLGMYGYSMISLLLACAASGLRTIRQQVEQQREHRRRLDRDDHRQYVSQAEDLLSTWIDQGLDSSDPDVSPGQLASAARNVLMLLLPELDGDQKGRLLRFLASRGLLGGALDLSDCDLSASALSAADLAGARLAGCDLRGADLADARLPAADLRGARLEGADLSAADLAGANLYRAALWSARLQSADLRDAVLAEAALDGANLWNANLEGADLRNARVTPNQLASAHHGSPGTPAAPRSHRLHAS